MVLVVADRRYRLKALAEGEVAIYTDEGDKIHFKRGRIIDIDTATLNIRASSAVNIDTPTLTQSGQIVSQGDQIAGGISQIQHVHSGVQPGPGQTGMPVGAEYVDLSEPESRADPVGADQPVYLAPRRR